MVCGYNADTQGVEVCGYNAVTQGVEVCGYNAITQGQEVCGYNPNTQGWRQEGRKFKDILSYVKSSEASLGHLLQKPKQVSK